MLGSSRIDGSRVRAVLGGAAADYMYIMGGNYLTVGGPLGWMPSSRSSVSTLLAPRESVFQMLSGRFWRALALRLAGDRAE